MCLLVVLLGLEGVLHFIVVQEGDLCRILTY